MRRILVILTHSENPLASRLISLQHTLPECQVETFDLTCDDPDYDRLLDKIFEADSVQVG